MRASLPGLPHQLSTARTFRQNAALIANLHGKGRVHRRHASKALPRDEQQGTALSNRCNGLEGASHWPRGRTCDLLSDKHGNALLEASDHQPAQQPALRHGQLLAACPPRVAQLHEVPRTYGATGSDLGSTTMGGSLEAVQLTRDIKAVRSLEQLTALVQAHGPRMNGVHLAACVSQVCRVSTSSSGSGRGQADLPAAVTMSPSSSGSSRLRLQQAKQQQEQQHHQPHPSEAPHMQLLAQLEALLLTQLPRQNDRLVLSTPQGAYELLPGGNARVAAARPLEPQEAAMLCGPAAHSAEAGHARLGARQLATVVHGLAKAGHVPCAHWMRAFYAATQQLLDEQAALQVHAQQAHHHTQQQPAIAATPASMSEGSSAALKGGRHTDSGEGQRMQPPGAAGFTGQELSMMVWGLARMQRRAAELQQHAGPPHTGDVESDDGTHESHGTSASRRALVHEQPSDAWVRAFCAVALALATQSAQPSSDASTVMSAARLESELQPNNHPSPVAPASHSLPSSSAAEAGSTSQYPISHGHPACRPTAAPSTVSPQDMATIPWALAVMGCQPSGAFLEGWATACASRAALLNGFDVSQLCWALARMQHAPLPAVMQQLVGRAEQVASQRKLKPQDTANLLWALARLRYDPGTTLVSAALQPLTTSNVALAAYKPVDASNVLWALAYLGHRPAPRFLHALVAGALTQAWRLGDQDLGNLMWGLARLGYQPPAQLLRGMLQVVGRHAAKGALGPAALSQITWAMARMQWYPPTYVCRGLLRCCLGHVHSMRPQGLVLALFFAVRMGHMPTPSQVAQLLAVLLSKVVAATSADAQHFASSYPAPQPTAVGRGPVRARRAPTAIPSSDSSTVPTASSWQGGASQSPGSAEEGEAAQAASSSAATADALGGTRVQVPGLDGVQPGAGLPPQAAASSRVYNLVAPYTLSLLLWSLGRLCYKPDAEWLRVLLLHTVQLLPHQSGRELACLAWALSRLKHRPNALWLHVLLNRAAQLHVAGELGDAARNCLVKHLPRLGAAREQMVQASLLPPGESKPQADAGCLDDEAGSAPVDEAAAAGA